MAGGACLVVAGCLTLAAVLKLRAPSDFRAVLARLLAARAVPAAVVAVRCGELALAAWLLTGAGRGSAAAVTVAVLAVFTAALARLEDCHCFGGW